MRLLFLAMMLQACASDDCAEHYDVGYAVGVDSAAECWSFDDVGFVCWTDLEKAKAECERCFEEGFSDAWTDHAQGCDEVNDA